MFLSILKLLQAGFTIRKDAYMLKKTTDNHFALSLERFGQPAVYESDSAEEVVWAFVKQTDPIHTIWGIF